MLPAQVGSNDYIKKPFSRAEVGVAGSGGGFARLGMAGAGVGVKKGAVSGRDSGKLSVSNGTGSRGSST